MKPLLKVSLNTMNGFFTKSSNRITVFEYKKEKNWKRNFHVIKRKSLITLMILIIVFLKARFEFDKAQLT